MNEESTKEEFEGFRLLDNKYVSIHSLHNHHRHFGTYINNIIQFDLEEMLYLFNKPPLKEYEMYFFFKDNNYNLTRRNNSTNEYWLFNKHKHFNRKKEIPIGICKKVSKENLLKDSIPFIDEHSYILRIESDDVCHLRIEKISELDHSLEEKDYK
ncbi:hypothetical protein H311_03544 [Anncaliia algerae PRA109]|nr:hypothetical protein H311_03544 [Anncaliia algerae PRA109]